MNLRWLTPSDKRSAIVSLGITITAICGAVGVAVAGGLFGPVEHVSVTGVFVGVAIVTAGWLGMECVRHGLERRIKQLESHT